MRVYIGWDRKEIAAYHVCAHSIIENTKEKVSISPVGNHVLHGGYWWRERGPYDTTDFSNARWAVPFLSGHEGWSLYIDSDVLFLADIAELWRLRDDNYAVMCVKHQYQPKSDIKAMGKQTKYGKKNWSSVVLFNNARCRVLSPMYINRANGLDLHQFKWLEDNEIGEIPKEWNWLVGEYPHNEEAKVLHYTLGGPYMPGYEDCEEAEKWLDCYSRMTGGQQWKHRA